MSIEMELLINQEAETNQTHDRHTLQKGNHTHTQSIPARILPDLIVTRENEIAL